jgi:hypothetical protein
MIPTTGIFSYSMHPRTQRQQPLLAEARGQSSVPRNSFKYALSMLVPTAALFVGLAPESPVGQALGSADLFNRKQRTVGQFYLCTSKFSGPSARVQCSSNLCTRRQEKVVQNQFARSCRKGVLVRVQSRVCIVYGRDNCTASSEMWRDFLGTSLPDPNRTSVGCMRVPHDEIWMHLRVQGRRLGAVQAILSAFGNDSTLPSQTSDPHRCRGSKSSTAVPSISLLAEKMSFKGAKNGSKQLNAWFPSITRLWHYC